MKLLFLLLIAGVMVYLLMFDQNRKLRAIQSSTVVAVNGALERYPTLPLGEYGVPRQFRSPDRVQVVFPKLTQSGEVEYIYSWHSLAVVHPVTLSRTHPQNRVRVAAELAPVIKEHLRLETDTIALENQYAKLVKLADLVATSDIYSPQTEIYDRAIDETEKLLQKTEELGKIYVRMVRETLIGARIAEFDPDQLIDLHVPLDEQYERIKSEYQMMKDTAQAYFELLKESRPIRPRSASSREVPDLR